MKTFDQLAQSAYEAYVKQADWEAEKTWVPEHVAWTALPQSERNMWLAAARQLWAEFAAIH